jgi:hypothetical protein
MIEPNIQRRRLWKRTPFAALGLLVALFRSQTAYSYSVLTHEAIIDSTWDSGNQAPAA